MTRSRHLVAVVAITRHGIALAGRVLAALPGATLFAPEKFRSEARAAAPHAFACFSGKTGDQIPALFARFDGIVAIVSLGAVVRLIAPHLRNKESDPGVVVLDEAARWAIPVLSGHLGGANAIAARLHEAVGATAVLTTASDARETLAVDLLGRELGWTFEASHDEIVRASAAMVNDEPVALVQEAGRRDWWSGHANGRGGPLPANLKLAARIEDIEPDAFGAVLWVSHRALPAAIAARLAGKRVIYRPPREFGHETGHPARKIALGLGCDRGTPAATIAQAIAEALAQAGAGLADVAAVASIDLKADEPGLVQLAARRSWRIVFYPAAALAAVPVPNPSETVRRYTGTRSVAEAAALLAAGTSLGADPGALLVEKHRRRGPDGRNATVSIARMPAATDWRQALGPVAPNRPEGRGFEPE
ncbi:MAG TPA: cobalamin biosynthesis protein [Rhodocyclaceae bacterium]|nr:cobalamin biosynthesis protein [Rhodocyclaceae bacterium]